MTASRSDHDPVHHPSHYTSGAVECIDAIEAALGPEGFIAFLRGQVIKYNWRLGRKDAPPQDAGKAKWYMDKLAERCGSGIGIKGPTPPMTLAQWGAIKQSSAATAQSIQGAALTDKKGIQNGTVIGDREYGSYDFLRSKYNSRTIFGQESGNTFVYPNYP